MSRKLHIGGQVKAAGWEVLDANPGPIVDHVADARDLSLRLAGFPYVDRVERFGMFNDTSNTQMRGVQISLNVVATKAG